MGDAVTQNKKILHDLNQKMVNVLHAGHSKQEMPESDEYMYDLDSKLRQIRKPTQTIKSSKIYKHVQQ